MYWVVALPALGFGFYWLRRWAKRADDIESDSAYLYENTQNRRYGEKFLNIMLFRDRD